MANARIVVVGSLMLDLVVQAPRLPVIGESLLGYGFATFVGGKGGNQALAAARLGADRVTMVGRVGRDDFGRRIVTELEAGGVDCQLVQRDPTVGTGVAIPIVLDGGANSIISIPQANMAMTAEDVEAANDVIRSASMLLVQSEVAVAATEAAMRMAKLAGVPVMINAAPVAPLPPGMLELADFLVVNEIEADALCPEDSTDYVAQVRALQRHTPTVVITLGEAGALFAHETRAESIPAFCVEAVDSVGAGDAFCGALAVALCEGQHLAAAVRFASAAGAVSVTRHGAAASLPTRAEVLRLMQAPA
jgi:ribokinase